MARNGLRHYFLESQLDESDVVFFTSFKNPSGNYFNSELGFTDSKLYLSGDIGSFTSVYGSGFCSGSNFLIFENLEYLDPESHTSLFAYEKKYRGGSILLSTVHSGSGYEFGVTDNDFFYVSSPTDSGSLITSSFELFPARKNLISLRKDGRTFSLGIYDVDDGAFSSYSLTLPENTKTDSNYLYLADNPNDKFNYKFSGFLDEFLLMNGSPDEGALAVAAQGFFRDEPSIVFGVSYRDILSSWSNIDDDKGIEIAHDDHVERINEDVFLWSGVGEISIISSGITVGGVTHVSGYESGYVIDPNPSDYTYVEKILLSYDSVFEVPLESGVVGYNKIPISPIGDIGMYKLEPVIGVTKWGYEYVNPIYEEIVHSGTSIGVRRDHYQAFSYAYTGVSADLKFYHEQKISSDGLNHLMSTHHLEYLNPSFQTGVAIVDKNEYVEFGNVYQESPIDQNFKQTFYSDGVIAPYETGTLEVYSFDSGIFDEEFKYSAFNKLIISPTPKNNQTSLIYVDGLAKSINLTLGQNTINGDYNTWGYGGDSASYVYSDSVANSQTFKYYNGGGLFSGDVIPYNGSDFIFVNGFKLLSGIDYVPSGSVAKVLTNDFAHEGCDTWGSKVNEISDYVVSESLVIQNENNQSKYAVFKNKKRIRRNIEYFPLNKNSNINSLQNLNIQSDLESIEIYD